MADSRWELKSILELMLTEIEAHERAGVVLQDSQNRPKKDQYTGATLTTRTHHKVWEIIRSVVIVRATMNLTYVLRLLD